MREAASDLLQRSFLGNDLGSWAAAVCLLAIAWLFARLLTRNATRVFTALASRTRSEWDDHLARINLDPIGGIVIVYATHVASSFLQFPEAARLTLDRGLLIGGCLLLALFALRLVDTIFRAVIEPWSRGTSSRVDDLLVVYSRKFVKAVIVLFAGVGILDQVGFDVLSILTGMGIGGLAVAFAAKETLGNILGSVQILVDQPFGVGDWIRVDGYFGEVHEIGLRSTKIITRSRVLVVIPNKRISEVAIENVSVGSDLAVDLELGLVYGTSAAELEEARAIVLSVLAEDERIGPEPLVQFLSFADSALVLRCTYFVESLSGYWEVQHRTNVELKRRFDERGLDFAFPTRTLHIEPTADAGSLHGSDRQR